MYIQIQLQLQKDYNEYITAIYIRYDKIQLRASNGSDLLVYM
jgi:hypothetical protein